MKRSILSTCLSVAGFAALFVFVALPALAQDGVPEAAAAAKAPLVAYTTYKTMHLLALFALFTTTGALFARAGQEVSKRQRIVLAVIHGLSLLLVLVGGFGLMARIGIAHNAWPMWIKLKFVFWIGVGALMVVPKRLPKFVAVGWFALGVFATVAVLLVQHKPL